MQRRGWQIARRKANEQSATCAGKALCLQRWEAQLCGGIKWGGFPVTFLSPHRRSSRGSTNVSPLPHWCLTEPPPPPPPPPTGGSWAAGKQTTAKVLVPSRDGSNYWQYYLQLWAAPAAALSAALCLRAGGVRPPGTLARSLLSSPSQVLFFLCALFLIYCTVALIQTICKFPRRNILFML